MLLVAAKSCVIREGVCLNAVHVLSIAPEPCVIHEGVCLSGARVLLIAPESGGFGTFFTRFWLPTLIIALLVLHFPRKIPDSS